MAFGLMKIVVFTKPGCSFCVKAKDLLDSEGLIYSEIVVGEDGNISKDSFLSLFPETKTLPLIKINDDVVGGYKNLVDWINKFTK